MLATDGERLIIFLFDTVDSETCDDETDQQETPKRDVHNMGESDRTLAGKSAGKLSVGNGFWKGTMANSWLWSGECFVFIACLGFNNFTDSVKNYA